MQVTRASSVGALLLGIGLLAGGCVTLPWQPTAGLYSSPAENFAVELPQGWMRLNSNEDLLITRDGTVEYERRGKRGAETSITAPIRSFKGDDFSVGRGDAPMSPQTSR